MTYSLTAARKLPKQLEMGESKLNLLATGPVMESLIEEASIKGINLEVVPFIDIEPIHTIETQQEIEQALLQSATVVFTSGNAVEAVATELEGHQPDWEIFCIGHKTLDLVTKHFGSELVAGIADNATELADVMAESTFSQEVIFFCGDQRRRDLPDSLREKGIEVIEIVVYQTLAVPKRLKKRYVGVLFFSPTAVNSYFKLNKANDNTIFFAIGETTARAIKQHTNKKILISESPGKEELVNIAIEFFS